MSVDKVGLVLCCGCANNVPGKAAHYAGDAVFCEDCAKRICLGEIYKGYLREIGDFLESREDIVTLEGGPPRACLRGLWCIWR